jgi:hypothetical protein
VIEGIETVDSFFSYGDMPPWGQGPVQGKIHGGPSYINDNFPKTDKFLHCKVERLNIEKEGDIVYKADHKTDEESFAEVRELTEGQPQQMKEPYRPQHGDQPGLPPGSEDFVRYGGVAVLLVMMIVMFAKVHSKKEDAKTN